MNNLFSFSGGVFHRHSVDAGFPIFVSFVFEICFWRRKKFSVHGGNFGVFHVEENIKVIFSKKNSQNLWLMKFGFVFPVRSEVYVCVKVLRC